MEVAEFSIVGLKDGFQNGGTHIDMGVVAYLVLGIGTAAKGLLYLYCRTFQGSDSVAALAEDHLNDVMSNSAAIITAGIAANVHSVWWLDPVGGGQLPEAMLIPDRKPQQHSELLVQYTSVKYTIARHVCMRELSQTSQQATDDKASGVSGVGSKARHFKGGRSWVFGGWRFA